MLCIRLYAGGVGIKLPAAEVAALLRDDHHAAPFQPFGKPKMREWVQIDLADAQEYRTYLPVFEASIRFIADQQEGSLA